ncbi:MAG: ImmA/IrrE family metallo-endopeptidase [Anaerolineae bacterium]|nr:ImmA/IrrE family metallo-endopeptidase [Anaerolineae bacterium]
MSIAERLRDFRKRAGLNQAELAAKLNLDTSLISRWEKGEREPSAQQLADFARVIGVSLDYVLNATVRPAFKFRAQSHAERNEAAQAALLAAEAQVHYVDSAHKLAQILPRPFTLRLDYAGNYLPELTKQVRTHLRLNERVSLDELIQALAEQNVFVFRWTMPSEISGASYRGAYTVIFINQSHSEARQLFTLAHELAHILFHLGQSNGIETTVSEFSSNRDPQEKEANAFAAELVMPSALIEMAVRQYGKQLRSPLILDALANWFNVSRDALFYRLVSWNIFNWSDKSIYFNNFPPVAYIPRPWVENIDCQVAGDFRRLALGLYESEQVSAGKLAEWFGVSRLAMDDYLFQLSHERDAMIEF